MNRRSNFSPWVLDLGKTFFVIYFTLSSFQLQKSIAQNARTDPSEVRALNAIFEKWDVKAVSSWNISGEPCTGSALDPALFKMDYNNPAITCNCTYNTNTTCHITQLKVKANRQGVIPEELAALTYLRVIEIDKNELTGPLPAFIGNLSALTVLEVGHNQLSGEIPKELGNCKELIKLAMGSNNFSGSIPPEIGNLVKLEEIYLDSSGLGGEIPSTFANLKKMQHVFLFDSPFTGKLPAFIGTWTKLERLRIQGNNFEGPIPSSYSNLTSLVSLRISDLQNVSSTLDFVKNMRNLTDLVLRNALISGSIPTEIIGLQNLSTLDLSFNNLTGQIPSTIMNMTSLTSLFLGNNSLSGPLLPDVGAKLQNIDLSYNQLSGRLPRWVTQTQTETANLQLNLVANNLKFDNTNISVLQGLHCLQRGFPCNTNATTYSSIAINCGGSQITADGILYETENSVLKPASYYIEGERWAVSNGGIALDNPNHAFIATTAAAFTSTRAPDLFRNSRMGPSSLRYYGLGLKNGPYNIRLLFAEIVLQPWRGRGKRVFDIYIQGNLQEKDFDISKEAGGVEIAVTKEFNVNVTENYVEIHLFWAGKGTCCIPDFGDFGPLISALRISPDVKKASKRKTGMIIGIVVAVAVVSLALLAIVFYWKRKETEPKEEEDFLGMGPKLNTYSYAELRAATRDFSDSNLLGEGGFGPVYKGILNDGSVVAVKQLSVASHHGKSQFIAEISTISSVQHGNLVKLYGCCIEANRKLLVYEYLANKSLDQSLFGKNDLHLDWPTRLNICLGTARGLAYLHEDSRPRIVHRDVKASNILLDAELCPKISDFGLAKLYDDKKTHISTRIAGTIGYLAPEYAMRGHLTSKADVFGFGVVCLEIVSGRPNYDEKLDNEQKFLLERAWSLYESNRTVELADPTLASFDEQEFVRVVGVALMCVQASPNLRPPMSRVVGMLSGDIELSTITTKPSYLTDWDFTDITTNSNDDNPLISNTSTGIQSTESPLGLSEILVSDSIREGR